MGVFPVAAAAAAAVTLARAADLSVGRVSQGTK